MSQNEHDLVVIGAGPGGYVAAIRAAQLGLNTACVEMEPALGGTCLRVGCIPSKAMLESSEKFWELTRKAASYGIECDGARLNLPVMLKRKDQIVSTLTKGIDALFKKNKITRYLGHGKIEAPGRVSVTTNGSEPIDLRCKHIIIATGSKAATIPGVQPDGDRIATSTEALSFPEVPQHLVVIGGGYIGLELGSVWCRLGAKVTILEYLDRILFGIDAEIAVEAKKLFEKQGLEFHLGAKVTAARSDGQGCAVEVDGREPLACDRVLVAVGRKPNTVGLGLESLGIELHKKGFIPVNQHFATNVDGIYAIGDVITGPMLAHKAEEEGVACVEQIVTGRSHVNYQAIAAVVYTHPEIGAVGLTEEQAKESGAPYRKGVFPFRANGRARTVGQVDGMVKVLADQATDKIIGVHVLGPHAGDLINEAAVAVAFGASAEDLARTCHVHPTLGEALREAALAVSGKAIHI